MSESTATRPGGDVIPPRDPASEEGAQALAERVVGGMLAADAFSRWLGIEVLQIAPRRCVARMTVRAEMCNGFGICHGGVTFSLADSAFAFACNTHGSVTVALDDSISYAAPVQVGDVLTVTAQADLAPKRVGFFRATIVNQRNEIVALFRGTGYDTRRPHLLHDLPARAGADS